MLDLTRAMSAGDERRAIGAVALAVPLLVFALHALLFRSWIVDDAGISFVYARNLAAGHGLVSQPGVPPVEGYSNPLWVLATVPFFLLGIFDPLLTPKLLSLLLIAAAFVLMRSSLGDLGTEPWLAPVALTLVALNTSFVAWSTSGLENPLYVCLLCLLCHRMLAAGDDAGTGHRQTGISTNRRRGPALTGLVAGAVALTRPEGVLFAALYPLARALASVRRRGRARSAAARRELAGLAAYGTAFGCLAGGYLAFRRIYFGELLPNTYYAKGGPETGDLLQRAIDLLSGVGARLGVGLALALVAFSVWLARRGALSHRHRVLGLFALWSALAHLLLPTDWMGEYRFATPFFIFFYAYAAVVIVACLRHSASSPSLKVAVLVATLVAQAILYAPRSAAFARRPTVPFDYVAERFAAKFDEYAARLGVEEASLMLPDVGATLYYSKLRIYDLVGLTDAVAARTFGRRPPAFRDYVFDRIRPTFIHLHEPWAARSGFGLDPRFRRDYLAIVEYRAEGDPARPDRVVKSGDFVRRDAVTDPAVLRALRRENAGLRP